MKKLLIFGASGYLGKGVSDILLTKDYGEIYLLGSGIKEEQSEEHICCIHTSDLSDEKSVINTFSKINYSSDDKLFLYSSIGGFHGGQSLRDTSVETWEKMFNSNLKTHFLIAREFINLAEKCEGGAICFTSAVSGFTPTGMRIPYGSAKSALNYLILALSEECSAKKISVMGIAPYILDTPENRGWVDPSEYDSLQKPGEIGELIDFMFNNYHFLSGNILQLKVRFS